MKYIQNKFGTRLVLDRLEQERAWAQNINDIMNKTRWFLDNMDYMPVFEYYKQEYRTGTGRHKKWKDNPKKQYKHQGIGTTFNATGWLYNGDTRPVDLRK